jgi:hypothetical protein
MERSGARASFGREGVAVCNQIQNTARRECHAMLVGLDLAGDANSHGSPQLQSRQHGARGFGRSSCPAEVRSPEPVGQRRVHGGLDRCGLDLHAETVPQ